MQLDLDASSFSWKEIKGVGIFICRLLGREAQNQVRVSITALAGNIHATVAQPLS